MYHSMEKKSPIAIRKVCYRDDLLTQSTNLSVCHFYMLLVFISSALPTRLLIRQTLRKVNKSFVLLRAGLKHNWITIPGVTMNKMQF